VEIKAPATAADNTLTFPNGNGSNGQILTTDGSGNLSFSNPADTDKITEGNTEAEVVDSGSDGHFKVTTEGSERVRVGPAGQIGIGGANYGSTGQVLTSTGGSSAASWSNVEISSDTSPQLGGHLDVNGSDIVTTSNGDIDLDPNGSGQVVFKGNATRGSGAVKLNCENNSHGILVKGPPHSAGANYTLTLPNDTGTSGQLLSTNGSGVTSWSTVDASPTFQATAGGALADGDPVIVNANGTVTKPELTATVNMDAGSEVQVASSTRTFPACAYHASSNRFLYIYHNDSSGLSQLQRVQVADSSLSTSGAAENIGGGYTGSDLACNYDANAQRVLVAFRNANGTSDGMCLAVDMTTSSNTQGTVTKFDDGGARHIDIAYCATPQKSVFVYQAIGASDAGKAMVVTVNGSNNSVSFGTAVTFNSANGGSNKPQVISIGGSKIVVVWADISSTGGAGNYAVRAVVGTISGTSVSFGSSTKLGETDSSPEIDIDYDSNADKVVVVWQNDSGYGEGIVGTVSGTSISFGTGTTFTSVSTSGIKIKYDPDLKKSVVLFTRTSPSNSFRCTLGTVSGTSISFSNETVLTADNVYFQTGIDYNTTDNNFCVAYVGSNGRAYGVGLRTSSLSADLTAENYIGISNGAYASGATATIQIVGSVDDAQSSLTPGQSYYVQTDGSLSTTAGTPSVFAGTAVAATKLIVKG
jgi:hypothetical protein